MKRLIPFVALLVLAACGTDSRQRGPLISNPSAPKGTAFQCEGGRTFSVEYVSGGAILYVTGQALRLKQVESASGTKYTDGAMTLWTKGADAMLLFNDAPFYRNCRPAK